mmetsp:Transcript_4434/g.6510  ORF Transcript_4434/g.6510 Transcript_4434/m.6510 type:complete len:80 (-) Transcript_4434:110-349(-)
MDMMEQMDEINEINNESFAVDTDLSNDAMLAELSQMDAMQMPSSSSGFTDDIGMDMVSSSSTSNPVEQDMNSLDSYLLQ